MKIALIGYGKMGKAIEEIAIQKKHDIVLKVNSKNQEVLDELSKAEIDVCIEFSAPHVAFDQVKKCLQAGIPTVSGTTAWADKMLVAEKIAEEHKTAFLWASNFSIGMNIFFEVNKKLASMMSVQSDYNVSMEEIHHTQKKDAPSGTAVSLAEDIIDRMPNKNKWVNHESQQPDEIPIISKRIDPAPGTHTIRYSSFIDDIMIQHTAHNRVGFATGAVVAAEFLFQKKGIYTMKDVLGLS
ncbi:MAG: 4-hydroxy-tetrahydrodipicolinate reductase [Chitinophagaceae bacterium]